MTLNEWGLSTEGVFLSGALSSISSFVLPVWATSSEECIGLGSEVGLGWGGWGVRREVEGVCVCVGGGGVVVVVKEVGGGQCARMFQ